MMRHPGPTERRPLAVEPTEVDLSRPATPPTIRSHGSTDIGRERDKNEDAFLIGRLERALVVERTSLPLREQPELSSGAGGSLFVVADGMGGEGGGDVASRVGIATVVQYVLSRMPWIGQSAAAQAPGYASLPDIRTALDRAVHAGDVQIKNVAAHSRHPHMGTTLTLAYVLWPRLYVAHVGDSRCYLYRDRVLYRLTLDHNVAEQLRMSGAQSVAPDSALQNVLWNALGGETEAHPQIERYTLMSGDALLLCSDGLNKHVSDTEIAKTLDRAEGVERTCEELVAAANRGGGTDNVTVVLARFDPGPGGTT